MIQIFGSKKDFDSKKAQNFFKERGIAFQFIDIQVKPISNGEFDSILQVLSKKIETQDNILEYVVDKSSKDFSKYEFLTDDSKRDFLFEHQQMLVLPICRNGKSNVTVGMQPDIWKTWL